jgi:hypothetical protein
MNPVLKDFASPKFNTWFCVYWMLGLDCSIRVIEALVFNWPLFLDLGSDMNVRKVALKCVFWHLEKLFKTMYRIDKQHPELYYKREGGSEKSELYIETTATRDTLHLVLGRISAHWILTLKNHIAIRYEHLAIDFLFQDPWPLHGEIPTKPLTIQLSRMKPGEPSEILEYESLTFFRYQSQIQRCIQKHMSMSPEYWKNKEPLPQVLLI